MLEFENTKPSPTFSAASSAQKTTALDHEDDLDLNAMLYQERKRIRDAKVNAVKNALWKHGVKYQETDVAHVVTIMLPDAPVLYLSLKSIRDDKDFVVYLYRIAGTGEWHKTRRDDFFAWLRQPSALVEIMPMGKFKGKPLAELLVTARWHLEWWYRETFAYPAHLRHTITTLLGMYPTVAVDNEISDFLPQLS